jgi:AbrB family looped-hinge helix DNA binding protein
MSEAIQVRVDSQGRILLPPIARERLGLHEGMTLVVEGDQEGELCLRVQPDVPVVVDKDGILVIRGRLEMDLSGVVQQERNQRVSDLLKRIGG